MCAVACVEVRRQHSGVNSVSTVGSRIDLKFSGLVASAFTCSPRAGLQGWFLWFEVWFGSIQYIHKGVQLYFYLFPEHFPPPK